jgi:colanic acid/amylovoran biosynthesis glycosyltransferase
MALGTPVVTTSVNGLADLVEYERTGLVVAQHDACGLAASLSRLLRNSEFAARLAGNARARVEASYSLERSVLQLRALFPGGG